jgi:hypothetical protein
MSHPASQRGKRVTPTHRSFRLRAVCNQIARMSETKGGVTPTHRSLDESKSHHPRRTGNRPGSDHIPGPGGDPTYGCFVAKYSLQVRAVRVILLA